MIDVTPATFIFNRDVYQVIPKNIKKIIEIGTGSGSLAQQIKYENPNINYIGVEIFDEYFKMSSEFCSKMYLENMEDASGELLREFIDTDVVIFADVLEHFKNPWNVLTRIGNWMPAASKIIACIPNIQHWSVQMQILAGDFEYQETGILDKTHLRFFTRKTIINLFEKTNFEIEKIIPRIFDFPMQNDFLLKIKKNAEMYGIDQNQAVNDAAAFQYVVVAKNIK